MSPVLENGRRAGGHPAEAHDAVLSLLLSASCHACLVLCWLRGAPIKPSYFAAYAVCHAVAPARLCAALSA